MCGVWKVIFCEMNLNTNLENLSKYETLITRSRRIKVWAPFMD